MKRFLSFFLVALFFWITEANAISLIRDAEIEDTLHSYADPIFKVAGLNPAAVHILIIDDPSINAYVAGGQNMFIHTGLILKTETPSMLIGVMAHETGHMAGGHLAQGAEQLKDAQLGSIIAAVLGAAVAVGGGGGAGVAIMGAGEQVALRNYLHFSRSNESAADQAGLNYLDKLHLPASGMLRVMEILRQNENRSYGVPDPYTRTHPLTTDRITHIRNHVLQSPYTEANVPTAFNLRHQRMLAKLKGFINLPEETLAEFPISDTSLPARYARAIAYYKIPELDKALGEIDKLIADHPNDPFFHEFRGQLLFEHGRINEAVNEYAKAVSLLPDSALIITDYAKSLIATENTANITKAIALLQHANMLDNSNDETWHHLAIAYGKTGNQGKFYLCTAEQNILEDNMKEAVRNADLALKTLANDNAARLRANDIKLIAEKEKKGYDSQ